MIPLRDSIRSRSFPIITIALIVVNILVFFREVSLGPHLEAFLMTNGFVPARFFLGLSGHRPASHAFLPLLTAMFLHGGWLHVLGNMWYLWIFGDNVEDKLGHLPYLVFYLGCGVASGLAHAFAEPRASLPAVGASGAIAGVLGAYFIFFPRGTVLTLVPLLFFITTIEIPAFFFLFFWFLMQWISGSLEMARASTAGGVAWWAHIGGFLVGAAVALVVGLANRRRE